MEREDEIREHSLLFEGLVHYFLVDFPQRPGILKEFIMMYLVRMIILHIFSLSKNKILKQNLY